MQVKKWLCSMYSCQAHSSKISMPWQRARSALKAAKLSSPRETTALSTTTAVQGRPPWAATPLCASASSLSCSTMSPSSASTSVKSTAGWEKNLWMHVSLADSPLLFVVVVGLLLPEVVEERLEGTVRSHHHLQTFQRAEVYPQVSGVEKETSIKQF